MSIDLSVSLWTVINFIVLMLLLNAILFRPLQRILDERKERVDSGLAAGEEARQAKLTNDGRLRDEVDKSRANARKLLENAQKKAQAERTALLRDAQVEAASIRTASIENVNAEEEQAVEEINSQFPTFVSTLAKTLLLNKKSVEQNKNAIERCVSGMIAKP